MNRRVFAAGWAVLWAGLFLLAPPLSGQGATTGSIRGQVTAAGGTEVVGAQVSATNVETGLRRGAVSDSEGRYSIPQLPSGTYAVRVQALGYSVADFAAVQVRVGEASSLNPQLAAQAVAVEGITVSGGARGVDVTQGGVRQNITTEQVENLPIAGRDFTDLINLSPLVSPQPGTGTGGQFSIAGARTSGTNVQIDGVDANNQFFGENRGSSRTPFAFSLESIRELQLITNGFDVEYGNYVGGVVNAVTRGGTNRVQGSAFAFLRNEALTADDFRGRAPRNFSSLQFGANVSGPVVKDRLHYFVSADAQVKDQPIFPANRFPASEVDAVVSRLAGLGYQNPRAAFVENEQAEDNVVLFGRLDWTVNDAHRLTVRQNFSDFEQTNDRVNSDEALTHGGPFRNRSWSTVGELNSVFGRNVFNTLRIQYSDEDRPRTPNTPGGYLPEFEIEVNEDNDEIEFGGDGVIFRNRLEERKLQLVDNLTFQLGAHQLKFGTNTSLVNTTNVFWLIGNGEFEFENEFSRGRLVESGLSNLEKGTPTEYIRFVRACPVALVANQAGQAVLCPEPSVPTAEFQHLEWSAYAQDQWQATDRLLLTGGVRATGTRFRDQPGRIQAVEDTFGVATGVVPSFTGISPRFSVAYDLGGDRPSALRGGVGLLIGRAPTVLAGNVFQSDEPLRRISCVGSSVPAFNLAELLAGARGENNPAACAGSARQGNPEYAVFDRDFQLPRTLKANVGYERQLTDATRFGIDLIYSRTQRNFVLRDLNLNDTTFTLASELGRPVFVAETRYNPDFIPFGSYFSRTGFERVYYNTSDGEARSTNVAVELEHNVGRALQVGARYAWNRAYDNSSFSCCTSSEGFDEPTAGSPNEIGGVGDERTGLWGPSDYERRHTFVFNFLYNGPWGIRTSGIMRSQSGTPWTPTVDGDVNGDGISYNDRAFVSRDLQFFGTTAEAQNAEKAKLDGLLNRYDCIRDQLGDIAGRNSCRNPWFHSLDLRVSKHIRTFGRQRAELLVDAFNVLNGLNSDWGRFMGVFSEDQLLRARSYDRNTRRIVYSVNEDFGETEPVGFDPFQFQLQVGVRYRF